jgi:hypothetical protein
MKRKVLNVVFLSAAAIGAAVIYWFVAGKERHELGRRRHQVTDVELACHMYASKHDWQFPRDLRELTEIYGQSSPFLARAVAELELMAPGVRANPNDDDTVLIREKTADAKGRRMVGYIDGRFSALGPDGKPIHPQPRDPGF